MDIVIAGALPHSSIATEALKFLPKSAPHLLQRLQTHHASIQTLELTSLACTPLEYVQLKAANLRPDARTLGAYYLPPELNKHIKTGQALFLGCLAHIELGMNHASLYTADELAITPAQSLALFESAQTVFTHSPYKFLSYHPEYFLVDLGSAFAQAFTDSSIPPLASPNLLATGCLTDWWPDDEKTRPLRALLAELQMTWFNHPVNQERAAQGLRSINTAWIFGGVQASPDILARCQAKPNYTLINTLHYAHRQQDWGYWLHLWSEVDQELGALNTAHQRLILCGLDRIVTLSPQAWHKQFLQSKNKWKTWW